MSNATDWVNQNKGAIKNLDDVRKDNPRHVVNGLLVASVNGAGDLCVYSTTIQDIHIISLARWMISTFSDIHGMEK